MSDEVQHSCGWKIAFADFMMAMFVIFLALWITNLEKKDQKAISDFFKSGGESMVIEGDSFGEEVLVKKMKEKESQQNKEKSERLVKVNQTLDFFYQNNVKDELQKEANEDEIKLTIESDQGFESGSAFLTEKAEDLVIKLAETLYRRHRGYIDTMQIEIHGHTDSVPIFNDQFSSNWDLSAARASTVANIFTLTGFKSGSIRVVGYADGKPKVANNSPENMKLNRRVEVFIRNS